MSQVRVPIYQLKITLDRSKPPIWRRLLVSNQTTLAELHDTIQISMGWLDSHLHMFVVGDVRFSIPYDEDHLLELAAIDSRHVMLANLANREGLTFVYEYDFGDGWEHSVHIEKILPPDPKPNNYPLRVLLSLIGLKASLIMRFRWSKLYPIPGTRIAQN